MFKNLDRPVLKFWTDTVKLIHWNLSNELDTELEGVKIVTVTFSWMEYVDDNKLNYVHFINFITDLI